MFKTKKQREIFAEKCRIARKILRRIRKQGGIIYGIDKQEMPIFPYRKNRKMRPYGVRWADQGCCPGHDKYPRDRYRNTNARTRHISQRHRKGSARGLAKRIIREELVEMRITQLEGA